MEHIKHILSYTRKAVDDYHMIRPGDKIAVGVSAGKDSLTLLCSLAALKRFYPNSFELEAITIDMGFKGGSDYSGIEALCKELEVPYRVVPSDIAEIVFDIRKEPILVYPTLHYQNGGLKITDDGQTDVENLYAAGEVVGGIHGRNRLMGNSLLDIIVFGRNAGRNASQKAKNVQSGTLTLSHVKSFADERQNAGFEDETVSPKLLPDYARKVK